MLRFCKRRLVLLVASVGVTSLVAVSAVAAVGGGHANLASLSAEAPAPYCPTKLPDLIKDRFRQPELRFSRDGSLTTRLRMSRGRAEINGETYKNALTYEGLYPGPMLVLCRGDKLNVRLENRIGEVTNLHVHGLHVSPKSPSDDVFVRLENGQDLNYEYSIPDDHPSGTSWYHPHHHGVVSQQIFGGLAGGILIQGGLDERLAGVPQRLMMITSTELCTPRGRSVPFPADFPAGTSDWEPCREFRGSVIPKPMTNERFTPLLVNGVINPEVRIRPGEIQRWRIFNANNNRIVNLRLGTQNVQILSKDGNTLRTPQSTKDLLIGPGSRREILVRGGPRGRYRMRARPFAQFPGGDEPDEESKNGGPTPNQTLLTVLSSGPSEDDRFPVEPLDEPEDLREEPVARSRTICFNERAGSPAGEHGDEHPPAHAMSMLGRSAATEDDGCEEPADVGPPTEFLVNGEPFDEQKVAATMQLGSVEEWTLINANTEWHTFHIHVNPFQIIEMNGKKVSGIDVQDNVAMPPESAIKIRMKLADFTGKFVFHCHVTTHEDGGMMAAVEVVENLTDAQRAASSAADGPVTVHSGSFRDEGTASP